MQALSRKIVICGGVRTAIGHLARSLAGLPAVELQRMAIESLTERANLDKTTVDGVLIGWVGQDVSAPNMARVSALKAGLPLEVQNVTFQNNCVSSIEAMSSACRFILAGEGELYIAGGTESMSRMPYVLTGNRSQKALRNMDTLKAAWAGLLEGGEVGVVDSLEQGLNDPVRSISMAGTAEIVAQMHGITREAQDAYAVESLKRCIDGWNAGFYNSHVVPVKKNGETILEKDEYPFLREDLVRKPAKMGKAPVAFDNRVYPIKKFFDDYGKFIDGVHYEEGKTKGTLTLFNAVARSDGAAAMIITTEEKAKALGLKPLAEIKSWAYVGNDPAHMGVAPALATPVALKRAGITFDDLTHLEVHEPFAATVLGIFKVGKEKYGHDWAAKNESKALNPNGGSIAMGHPLGATGARLMLNLVYAMKDDPKARHGLIASCAGGGVGGVMVVEKCV